MYTISKLLARTGKHFPTEYSAPDSYCWLRLVLTRVKHRNTPPTATVTNGRVIITRDSVVILTSLVALAGQNGRLRKLSIHFSPFGIATASVGRRSEFRRILFTNAGERERVPRPRRGAL